MKILSLNTWCGVKFIELEAFLQKKSKEIDIFCFQEVRNGDYLNKDLGLEERKNLFKEMKNILTDFSAYYLEMAQGVGLALFIKSGIEVLKVESTQILTADDLSNLKHVSGYSYYPRLVQSVYLKNNLIVHNFHGISGASKVDTPERELQTSRLLEYVNKNNEKQIIVGDFNLNINTQAITRLDEKFRNLIKESSFKTTRNHNYKPFKEMPFADYAFVSQGLTIKDFKVLDDEVSDHLALFLEIN